MNTTSLLWLLVGVCRCMFTGCFHCHLLLLTTGFLWWRCYCLWRGISNNTLKKQTGTQKALLLLIKSAACRRRVSTILPTSLFLCSCTIALYCRVSGISEATCWYDINATRWKERHAMVTAVHRRPAESLFLITQSWNLHTVHSWPAWFGSHLQQFDIDRAEPFLFSSQWDQNEASPNRHTGIVTYKVQYLYHALSNHVRPQDLFQETSCKHRELTEKHGGSRRSRFSRLLRLHT